MSLNSCFQIRILGICKNFCLLSREAQGMTRDVPVHGFDDKDDANKAALDALIKEFRLP